MPDTTSAAEAIHLATIRALPPEVRLRQALDMSEACRRLLVTGLRTRSPHRTDLELIELSLGRRLVPTGAAHSTV